MVNQIFLKIHNKLNNKTLMFVAFLMALVAALFIFVFSPTSLTFFPTSSSEVPLSVQAVTDKVQGGDTTIVLHERNDKIHFDFTLSQHLSLLTLI